MKSLRAGRRGAVTIIVSIMLIPAVLLSGTSVDLARIHTAKSIASNANLLAANAALTQYDALLKDLYGLFGVADDDPILGDMINDYIEVAVFGEDPNAPWIDTGLGALQLFHGSSASGKITPASGYDLGNADVLRRQIEEYMKFRGPVILVERLLDAIPDGGRSLKASSDAIDQQKIVNDEMMDLLKMYTKLYDAIQEADQCGNTFLDVIGKISDRMEEIKSEFVCMKGQYRDWVSLGETIENLNGQITDELDKDEPNQTQVDIWNNEREMSENERNDIEKEYNAKRAHITALVNGGGWTDYTRGEREDDGAFDDGTPRYRWESGVSSSGSMVTPNLQRIIDDAKNQIAPSRSKFQDVVNVTGDIDGQRAEVRSQIMALRDKINDPNCDPTLKTEFEKEIETCEELVGQFPNMKSLAEAYQTKGEAYLDDVQEMLGDIKYRDKSNTGSGSLSITELGNIAASNAYKLNEEGFDSSKAKIYAAFGNVTYTPPDFTMFKDTSGEHRELYNKLQGMAGGSGAVDPKSIDGLSDNSGSDDFQTRQQNIIDQLTKLAEEAKDGLISNPQGAREIRDDTVVNGSMNMEVLDPSKVIELISDPDQTIQEMADWILMMTYDASMFSSYTTGKPVRSDEGGSGAETEVSVTNVPMSPMVNYFYQSEWEYLLVGKKDAVKNLDAVRDLIYAIRMICNLIAAFSVPDVITTATHIRNAALAVPYVGAALGAILYVATFAAFASAESAVDLVRLRNGYKVSFLKTSEDWVCQRTGFVNALKEIKESGNSSRATAEDDENGVSYEQYMLVFFILTSSTDELVERTGNLIEWNVINYKSKANANHMNGEFVDTNAAVAAMSDAFGQADCFRLAKRHTDFDVTTSIDLRLLFLSMPMFQRQGSPFSHTFPVKITDSRGY